MRLCPLSRKAGASQNGAQFKAQSKGAFTQAILHCTMSQSLVTAISKTWKIAVEIGSLSDWGLASKPASKVKLLD